MRIGLPSFTLAVAAAAVLAPAALADTSTLDLYVTRDACGGTADQGLKLSATLGASPTSCGNTLAALGGSPEIYTSPAGEDHMPLPLDASRPVHVAIDVTSFVGTAVGGIGDETVDAVLTGKRGPTNVTLGHGTATTPAQTMLTQAHKLYEFDFPLDATKAGTYKSFTLTLTVGGSQFSGFVDQGGKSLVSIPTFDYVFPPDDSGE